MIPGLVERLGAGRLGRATLRGGLVIAVFLLLLLSADALASGPAG